MTLYDITALLFVSNYSKEMAVSLDVEKVVYQFFLQTDRVRDPSIYRMQNANL